MKLTSGLQEFHGAYQSASHRLGVSYAFDAKLPDRYLEAKSEITEPAESPWPDLLERWRSVAAMEAFVEFYQHCDGAELFAVAGSSRRQPLIRIAKSGEIESLTRKYREGGRWFTFTTIGKAHEFFSQSPSWFVFGEVCGGPACFLSFVEGENSGKVYFVEPQPRFNIYKPTAPSIGELLHRLSVDPVGQLRKYDARVTIRGEDGANYGYRVLTIERI